MKTADPCVMPAICAADGMWCSVMWVVRCDVCVCVQVDLFSRTVESLDCYTNRNALVITTARCACCCHPFFRHFLACKFHPAYSHTTHTLWNNETTPSNITYFCIFYCVCAKFMKIFEFFNKLVSHNNISWYGFWAFVHVNSMLPKHETKQQQRQQTMS